MIRVGLLSAAHVHTDAYADVLTGRADCTLVGVADEDPERGREAAARYGVEYLPADDLLETVDATVICASNAAHREWFERAAAADVAVLCEKPLAPTLADARAMVDCWKETGIVAGVAMPVRFSGPARRARERLDSGAVGSLRALSGANRGKMPGGWFADPELAGGGAVMDHTVHLVDLVSVLTGERVVEVYAEADTRFHDVRVEDVNVLSMELADGTPFLLDGSWSRPDAWHTWGDATLELVGSEGTIAIDYTDQSLLHTTDSGVQTAFYGPDADAAMIDDFLESVREGTDPAVTPKEGLAAVAVVEAAYESIETGEPVAVR